MYKILYKDVPYFYKMIIKTNEYGSPIYYSYIFVENTGFWKFIKKYKCIGCTSAFSYKHREFEERLYTEVIDDYIQQTTKTPVMLINCSDDVKNLYS
jgi:hypothetical protein